MFDNAVDFKQWLKQELNTVRQELGMETGIASFIAENDYTIVEVDSDMEGIFEAGQVFPLQDTYCRAVVESEQAVKYNHVATIKTMLQHPVYQAVKLESYIASPIFDAQQKVIGTINFTSLQPHKPKFNVDEQQLVDEFTARVSENAELYKALIA
ncbi:MAG: GAF domain-containing protein [Gammaproteobacteria bacterium]|nr:GAF domain-containing protein [Gammaproteobacteria bacterium]